MVYTCVRVCDSDGQSLGHRAVLCNVSVVVTCPVVVSTRVSSQRIGKVWHDRSSELNSTVGAHGSRRISIGHCKIVKACWGVIAVKVPAGLPISFFFLIIQRMIVIVGSWHITQYDMAWEVRRASYIFIGRLM